MSGMNRFIMEAQMNKRHVVLADLSDLFYGWKSERQRAGLDDRARIDFETLVEVVSDGVGPPAQLLGLTAEPASAAAAKFIHGLVSRGWDIRLMKGGKPSWTVDVAYHLGSLVSAGGLQTITLISSGRSLRESLASFSGESDQLTLRLAFFGADIVPVAQNLIDSGRVEFLNLSNHYPKLVGNNS